MKVLYIITQAEMGGAQKYVLDLCEATKGEIAAGVESDALFIEAGKRGLVTHSLRYLKRSINPLVDLAAITEIQRLIKATKPDIVHLNSSKAGILGSCAAIGLGAKVVFTAHGFVFNEPLPSLTRSVYRFLEGLSSYFRDMVIAVSEADRESALRYKIIPPEKITVIHNGISQIEFYESTEARQRLGLEAGKITVGAIGNFYKNKGFDILTDAVSLLTPEVKDKIQVVIIGSGAEFENIKDKLSSHGGNTENLHLTPSFILPGSIPDAAKYLKAFDVFALPSRKEGFSYILLEAMQAGLPIIATDVGGNREALEDAGIIIQPEDMATLAGAITKLAASEEMRESLGQKALNRSKLFTKEKMIEQTLAVYQNLLK